MIKNTGKSTRGSGVSHIDWDLRRRDHSLLVKSNVGSNKISLHELFEGELDLSILVNILSIESKSFIGSLVQNCVNAILLGESFEEHLNWHGLLPELLVGNQLELRSVEREPKVVPISLLDGELGLGGFPSVPSYCEVVLLRDLHLDVHLLESLFQHLRIFNLCLKISEVGHSDGVFGGPWSDNWGSETRGRGHEKRRGDFAVSSEDLVGHLLVAKVLVIEI